MKNTCFSKNSLSSKKIQTFRDNGVETTFSRFCSGYWRKKKVVFLNEKTSSTTLAFPPRRAECRDLKGLVGLWRKQLVCQRRVWKHWSKKQVIFQQCCRALISNLKYPSDFWHQMVNSSLSCNDGPSEVEWAVCHFYSPASLTHTRHPFARSLCYYMITQNQPIVWLNYGKASVRHHQQLRAVINIIRIKAFLRAQWLYNLETDDYLSSTVFWCQCFKPVAVMSGG